MINSSSRTFKGHAELTTNNVDRQALVAEPPISSRRGEERVKIGDAENVVPVGAYSANPGHEDNSVSVDVIGEFEIRMKEAVDAADLNKGVALSDTDGLCKSVATGGLGRIIGGRTSGTKHYARIIV